MIAIIHGEGRKSLVDPETAMCNIYCSVRARGAFRTVMKLSKCPHWDMNKMNIGDWMERRQGINLLRPH